MDNLVKIQKCLPELWYTVAPYPGALEALIKRAEFEIDQYDLEMDVIDFLEDLTVTVKDRLLLCGSDTSDTYWSVKEKKWVEDEECFDDE